MKKIPILFVLCLVATSSAETDGAKLTDQEIAAKLATKVSSLPPGIKTRGIKTRGFKPQDGQTRTGAISPEAYQKTRSAIDLARTRAVRLNLGASTAPSADKTNPTPAKNMELACPVSMASAVAFRLQFNFNQDTFADPPVAGTELDKIATALKSFVDPAAPTATARIREQFLIEGHTCDIGDERPNQILSEKRAMAVREQLVTRGVPVEMLLVLGQGETHPDAPNSSEANRALNRRVAVFRLGEKATAAK
jgi:outer membrane protein OmpA-like peptidoglycan-associated protein